MSNDVTFDQTILQQADIDAFRAALPKLLEELRLGASIDEPLVQVDPQWWGLVFILSDEAAKQLASGLGGVGAVAGALALLCAKVPGLNIALTVVTGILTIHMMAIIHMNRGMGVYVTAAWPLISMPPLWIPTPRWS